MNDIRSRKYLITFNNSIEKGFTHDSIKQWLSRLTSCIYWCMCDEIGLENKMYHTHLYLHFASVFRLTTLQKFTMTEHIDVANGTSQQNRDYVRKDGKYTNTEKKETNLPETFEEFGEMPIERQGKRNDIDDLYDLIKSGSSNFEILEQSPQYLLQLDKIDRARQIVKFDKYRTLWRSVDVTYIYGKSGTGKTRQVMELYGYENVFRVTDYDHPFDNYSGQDVICFEEFRGDLKIQSMLNYLDSYPLELPSRYANKVACYTKVYILTNLDITEQYVKIQENHFETWQAFLRRIHHVEHFTGNGVDKYDVKDGRIKMPLLSINEDELPF